MSGLDKLGTDTLVRQAMDQIGSAAAGAVTGVADQASRTAQTIGSELGSRAGEAVQQLGVHATETAQQISAAAAQQLTTVPTRFELGGLAYAAMGRVQDVAVSVEIVATQLAGMVGATARACHASLADGAEPILTGQFSKAPVAMADAIGKCVAVVADSVTVLLKTGP